MPPPILRATNVEFGSRSRVSQTAGGLEPIVGVNCLADPSVANRVNATQTSIDGYSFTRYSYFDGVQFYAFYDGTTTTTAGAQINTIANRRLKLMPNGCVVFGPWDGSTDARALVHHLSQQFVAHVQKAANHSTLSLNYGGGVMVTHDDTYTSTPGYGGAMQLYALAGMQGLIIGSNSYVGSAVTDYTVGNANWLTETADGFIRFELGPIWPNSERMRINPNEVLIGNTFYRHITGCTQSGDRVTSTSNDFTLADEQKYICWADYTNGGVKAYTDRIKAYVSPTQVDVETVRTISTPQAARVCAPSIRLTEAGVIYADSVFVKGDVDQVYRVIVGSNALGTGNGGELMIVGGGGAVISTLTTTYEAGGSQTYFAHEGVNVWSALATVMTFHGNVKFAGLRAEAAAAPTAIASAGTIAPVKAISFVSGTAAISTITVPAPISTGGGQLIIIPTGNFTWDTAGNIALAGTAVTSKAIIFVYDSGTTKWYPSYV